jgi:hypothetical protein
VDLFLGRVEGEVAYVEGCRIRELLFESWGWRTLGGVFGLVVVSASFLVLCGG